MTTIGFNSKRQASLDTLDHIGYQGRESRPEELAPKPVESFYSLEMRPAGEGMSHGPNPWREAIEAELICLHLGTVDSFLDAKAALNALIDWHVAVALDPEVSSDAQALIDRGAAAPVPVPPGWKLVPVEPTKAMDKAAYAAEKTGGVRGYPDLYRAKHRSLPGGAQVTDRELLELAAKAAGIEGTWDRYADVFVPSKGRIFWNPLEDDGDALRLAVKLRLRLQTDLCFAEVPQDRQLHVPRRAIVRAAAEIGKAMP